MTLKSNGPTINIEDPALEIHREKIKKLLDKNKDMMAENFYELGKAKEIQHTIPTTGQIVYQRPRRQAKVLQKFIEKEVEDMLSCGIISPSTSPHNTPINLAKKKDGGYRFCLDFRQLNTITTKDKYPHPRIDDRSTISSDPKFFQHST